MVEFLRRNMLVILFSILIIGQVLTWRALLVIQENSGHYDTCGRSEHPCYVIIIPNAR